MVTLSTNWPHLEVQDTINVLATDIPQQLLQVYDNGVMQRQQVAKWCHNIFIWQRQCDGDNQSGRPSSLMTEVNTAHIKELIHTDRHAPIWHMAPDFELCHSTVQYIMVGVLQYHEVCTRWVPCALKDLENMAKMMACLLPTTLRSCGKQMSATVHHWQ